MAFTDGVDAACPVCGGNCQGFPNIPLPSNYPFLSEAQMADHPKTDKPQEPDTKRRTRRARARQRRSPSERAKPGPTEDREKRHDEDR